MLTVPPALLDLLQLRAGAEVGIAVEKGRLVVAPHSRPKYRMDELLAQTRPARVRSAKEREWVRSKPVGRELI